MREASLCLKWLNSFVTTGLKGSRWEAGPQGRLGSCPFLTLVQAALGAQLAKALGALSVVFYLLFTCMT